MAAATYAQHPDNAYAGYGSEADPYNANNAGAFDAGYGAAGPNDYEYPADGYNNGYPDDQQQQQQQPAYGNNYQQAPYPNNGYDMHQAPNAPANAYGQPAQHAPMNGYGQQPQNGFSNGYPPQPQNPPPNMYGQQQPTNVRPNSYGQQPPHNPQQAPHPNDYDQPPYANGGYPTQQGPKPPSHAYGQPKPPGNQQQPFYPEEYQQPPYDHDDYPPQQHPHPDSNPYGQQPPPPRPQQQQQQHPQQQQQPANGYPYPQVPKIHRKSIVPTNNTDNDSEINASQPPYGQPVHNQFADPRNHQQTFVAPHQRDAASPVDNQYHRNPPFRPSVDHQATNRPPRQEQPPYPHPPSPSESNHRFSRPRISETMARRPSTPDENEGYRFEPIPKASFGQQEPKPHRQRKDDARDPYSFPSQNKFSTSKSTGQNVSSQTDVASDLEKKKRNAKPSNTRSRRDDDSPSDDERRHGAKPTRQRKQSRSRSKSRKNDRDRFRSEDDYSSDDDDCRRCRSRKTTTLSDTHLNKNSRLPPLRRLNKSSHHEPHGGQRSFPKPTAPRRFSQHDDALSFGPHSSRRSPQPTLRDATNRPTQHRSRDPYPDRDSRNGKAKRLQRDRTRSISRHRNDRDAATKSHRSQIGPLKSTRARRRSHHVCDKCGRSSADSGDEYSSGVGGRGPLKRNEIPYSHPPIRSVTYVENERIRAVRDAKGYYIPYRQYTLKDYNELKKGFKLNPYGDPNETSIDRKEMLKKGQEYGTFIEKQVINSFDPQQTPTKENQPVKPWHGGISAMPDPDDATKRERAIEYAKVQVRKYQEMAPARGRSHKSDTDRYCPRHLPKLNEWPDKQNQVANDDD